MKQGKKWMLVAIALLAMVTVALPLVGCKNDSVSEQTNVPEGEKPTTPEGGEGTVARVSFKPATGAVDVGTKVELSTSTGGAKIQYHQGDGQWKDYDADTVITINADTTITAKATKDGMLPSGEFSASYHIHSFDEAKWESDATNHWHPATCEHTDLKGSFAAHSFDWVVKTESTDEAVGKLVGECTVCGHEEEQSIPVGFVYVKGGTVTGSGSDGVFIAERSVTLSDFFMGRHEVTQAEWKAVMGENNNGISTNPSSFTGDNLPVENVSWYDAVYFCNELTKKTMSADDCVYTITNIQKSEDGATITSADVSQNLEKNGYRLPTEAEWEYAARGGNPKAAAWNYTYAGSNTIYDVAWYDYNSWSKTHQVGEKAVNSLGLYDMSGNVYEWCWDWSGSVGTGEETPVTDPTGPTSGSYRVLRGGCWKYSGDSCSVSYRNSNLQFHRNDGLGFRVVRPAK